VDRTVPETPLSLGYRLGVGFADSGPLESLPLPAGLFGRYVLSPSWSVGLSVDFLEGEVDGLAARAGLSPAAAEEDEALVASTQVSLWAERSLWRDGEHLIFGRAGIAAGWLDFDDARGSLAGGGTYQVQTESERETIGLVGLGYRYDLPGNWEIEFVGQYEHHRSNWRFVDVGSGANGRVGDYGLASLLIGIGYRF